MLSRKERLQRIEKNPEVSVLIVGAGANGIGTFLDLALQGVDVLMIDRGDYCSGASAASSHMVHGGIRYLENGEFRLVREAVQERNRLLENAPHLVRPLPTTFPIFKYFSGLLNAPFKFLGILDRPAERGAIVIKIGMTLYDFYTRKQKTVPRHVLRNNTDSLKLFPLLNPEIIFTGTYYDGSMPSPERIALELITDAVQENKNAYPLNYVRLVSATGRQVTLKDEIGGATLTVAPQILINAGGPWIDQINASFGLETEYIGGTKGSHVVIENPELRAAIGDNEFFFENNDGRIVLIYPLEDKVLIGTSDLQIDDPDQAVITDQEVQYFIQMIERVFPTITVTPAQIVFTLSGVRPLTNSKAPLTGQISRDHQIMITEPDKETDFPILSLIGGKWTTYRAFSEKASDAVLQRLGKKRAQSTRNYQIGGGKGYPKSEEEKEKYLSKLGSQTGITSERLEILFARYGTRAERMLAQVEIQHDPYLHHFADVSQQEVKHIVENEDVVHLDDFILRRSMLGKLGYVTAAGLEELGRLVGQTLGWDEAKIRQEINRVIEILRTKHRMDFNRFIQGQ
jgi:glycerol-3-phosphate dehydrogenase